MAIINRLAICKEAHKAFEEAQPEDLVNHAVSIAKRYGIGIWTVIYIVYIVLSLFLQWRRRKPSEGYQHELARMTSEEL